MKNTKTSEKRLDNLLAEISENLRKVRDSEVAPPTRIFRRNGDNFSIETSRQKARLAA